MVQLYKTSGTPAPTGSTKGGAAVKRVRDGVLTVGTDYAGDTDPSTGASWGPDEVGLKWLDTSGLSASPPTAAIIKRWEEADGGGSWGWRVLGIPGITFLDDPVALTIAGSPAAADIDWTEYDFTADLDTVQQTNFTERPVIAVQLRQRVKTGASETLGTDDAYVNWRKVGATVEKRVPAHVVDRWNEDTFWVPLDAYEKAERKVVVGGGTKAFEHDDVAIVGFIEAL